jgi:hypothetical protein
MKILNKEYINKITVTCDESERLETIEKLCEQGFKLESEFQLKSNESTITVCKKIQIKCSEPLGNASSEIGAARLLSKTLRHIKDDEFHKPEVISSTIMDYSLVVSFFTWSTGGRILIYIEKVDNTYIAVGYSEEM